VEYHSYYTQVQREVYINRIVAYIMVLYEALFFLDYWICVFLIIYRYACIMKGFVIMRFLWFYDFLYIPVIIIPESGELDSHQRYLVVDKLTYISNCFNYIVHYHSNIPNTINEFVPI